MPRAHRHFIPGHIWHITHRCHRKEFLLRFARDRDAYLDWLLEARKRFGLILLDYAVTSNHVHLLVQDSAGAAIARSMQLVAGRIAQQYNQRKGRSGAFWEDRYHATAIEAAEHLHRCIVYVDLNMVRAGVVARPEQWPHAGYNEIQSPSRRYRLIDVERLAQLCAVPSVEALQQAHRGWVADALAQPNARDARWSEAIAVGGREYVERVHRDLGVAAAHRTVEEAGGVHVLREERRGYQEISALEKGVPRLDNAHFWNSSAVRSKG